MEHQWLWDIFGSQVRTGVGVDDEFDENEDLPEPPPRQELTEPENLIDIPEPSGEDDGEFFIDIPDVVAEPMKNWREVLEGLAYPSETVTITDQEISGVESTELGPGGWTIREEGPDYQAGGDVELDADQLAEGVKQELLDMADRLLEHAGHSSQFKGRIYAILLAHVRTKFLDGTSLGLAERHHLEAARRMLPHVERTIKGVPGLVEGMVKYGD